MIGAADMVGDTVGHYRVLEKLGSGGMGEVYLAEDIRLRRRVALKVLPASMAGDPERLERFTREAMAVGALNHPNIVTIYSIEQSEGLHVLAMELIGGGTLAERIPPGGLDEEAFFEIAVPLADAVSAAHERGVTHRDLKPSNVMLTEDGRVKVVDFGLAKLRQESQAQESTVLLGQDLTEAGRVLGTYPYMAPEQIKGRPADHRADIFALGVVLYEMATGERPFTGESSADLMSAILRDAPPPIHELNPKLPRHLERILLHCLEKDPDRRFQTAKDLRNELQSLRSEIESERILRTSTSALGRTIAGGATALGRGGLSRRFGDFGRTLARPRLLAGLAALAVAAALTLALYFAGERSAPGSVEDRSAAASDRSVDASALRPSVAVLFFQNLTGEAELEWLRTGLAEMLVTDLSQSPEIRVTSTDRLYQILRDLDALDQPILSADLVRAVADEAEAGTVLLGSYARAGENLLVNVTLQSTADGEIVDAQRVQGTGVESVFSIVDRLGRAVRSSFERSGRIARRRDATQERSLETVTTSSVEAYRLYVEGMRLRNELKMDEATALLERATELDPGFATANAQLARIYELLGREGDFERAVEEALAHADRLPAPERYYIEGMHQSLERAGYARAIATFEDAVALYPDLHSARNMLGLVYSYLELDAEATTEFEELLARGHTTSGVYNSLASVYGMRGRNEDARRLLSEWIEREPNQWSALLILAWHAINWGDSQLAEETLERAEEIRPGSEWVDFFHLRLALHDGRLDAAADAAERLVADPEPAWKWRGRLTEGNIALFHGRHRQALERFVASARAHEPAVPLSAVSRNFEAELLLELDRPDEALRAAEAARAAAPGDWPAWEGAFWGALALERLGRSAEADRLADELAEHARSLPGAVEERLHRRLLGLLARERGDLPTARRELEAAVELLPPRGLLWHRHRYPDHGDLWYELATVAWEQGDERVAERWFRRLVASGVERIDEPVEFVRSHHFLGRLAEARGDRQEARRAYRTFLAYWDDGDFDRERVADARLRLSRLD